MGEAATIDTAPRDGTHILGKDGFWREMWLVRDQYEGEFWRDEFDSEPEPTHWAPLPDTSPRSDDGDGKPVAWVIGGENEGRGAFVTKSRDVMEVAKARDLLIQPLFAAPPSPTPSGEVGELARLLNAAADAFERDAEDGFEAGERADLWDQVVEVPLKDVRQAASLLLSLDAERARMRTALKSAKRLCDNINEFGHVTDQVFHDEAEAKIRSALPASDEKDSP